jgi:hypothetical protein
MEQARLSDEENCLKMGVHPERLKVEDSIFGMAANALVSEVVPTVGV